MSAVDAVAEALNSILADPRPSELVNRDRARIALDALKAAGYAVVKLPEPDSKRYEGDEHEPADRDSWMVDAYEVAVWYPGEVQINYDGSLGEPVDTAIARDLASALLAAIDAAEDRS